MKKMYWRPQRVSLRVLLIIACLAVAGLVSIETFAVRERQPFFEEKVAAARLTRTAFETIREERKRRAIPIDPEADPAGSGLIGQLLSPVSTNPGVLPAKQTSVNPNWGAVVAHLLKRAGVEPGDYVAVGLSGSFPALNIATLAAIQAIGANGIVISSAGASQWGANIPTFMWPDMEKILFDRRVLTLRSAAISRGGIDDRALGLSRHGRRLLDDAILRSGVPLLEVRDYNESVEKRMSLYKELAGDNPIKAYVNVGGGTVSVGTKVGKLKFKPGLNTNVPRGAEEIDSVMTRFADDGVPIIHLTLIEKLAVQFGLPEQPVIMPLVGEGKVFVRETYQMWLVWGVLLLLILVLYAFVRLDWGYRVLSAGRRDRKEARPEPMV
jgi:poly-gamma-glutamate system protein